MAKALKIAAVVVGVAALAVVTGGAALGLGVSLATTLTVGGAYISAGALLLGAGALAAGASLLAKKPGVTASQTDRLNVNIDPGTFRKTVLGQTAMPVDVRYEEFSGANQEYCDWIAALASHSIDGVEEIWLNTEMAWSATTGTVGKYVGYFSVPNLVLEGTPANAFTFASGKWNAASAHLTGCAYLRMRFKLTGNGKKAESPFAGGIPSRITIIGRGAKLYDPRRDSTVPGGSGPMRWNDQSTWRYTTDDGAVIGENLPLQVLRILLGWRIRNPVTGEMRLATGSGVPGKRISFASFQVAANIADELVNRSAGGNEPRFHGAAVISEGDEPKTILDMLCAACCGRFRDTSGKLSFVIAHNDLAAASLDDGLNDDDVVGAFSWDPDPSLEATPNVVRGKYVDATTSSLYQLIDYPEVRLPSPDGQDRILPMDLGAVESPSQAQRIAKQVLQRRQYAREFAAPFDIRAWKYAVGDVVPFTFAALGFSRVTFRVKEQELGQDGVCNMTLTFETPIFYQWDADDALPVQAADPIVYDSRNNPLILAIAEAAETATWDGVTGDGRPADNATNGADPDSPFGSGTVKEAQATLDRIVPLEKRFDPIESDISALEEAKVGTDASLVALTRATGDQAAVLNQIERDAGRLDETLLRLLSESTRTRAVLRDAGIVVDPVTGIVRIYSVDQLADRTSRAETAIDGVNAKVTTKAEVAYVNEQIALAVLDPTQAAQLEPIIARLTSAEQTIDGLNAVVALKAEAIELTRVSGTVTTVRQDLDALAGTVSTKAEKTVVDALGIRTGYVEQTLSTLGNVSGNFLTIRQARAVDADAATVDLYGLLAGDSADRRRIVAQSEIRQELFTKIVDGLSAEAVARTLLSVKIGDLDARSVQETTLRIAVDKVLGERIDSLSIVAGDQAAAIATLTQATIGAGVGIAGTQTTIRQQGRDSDQSAEALLGSLIAGDQAGRRQASQLTQIVNEFTTTLIANEAASAVARQALLARLGLAEAAIVTTSKVLADTTQALTSRIEAAEAVFNDAGTGLAATLTRLIREETLRADGDRANAEALAIVSAQVNDPATGLPATLAEVKRVDRASGDRDQALGQSVQQVSARIANAEGDLDAIAADIVQLAQARVDGDKANADLIQQVRARLDGVGGVGVEQAISATVDRLGKIEGRYTVTVDANGNVSGFQLIGSNAGPGSLNLINTDLRMGTGRVIYNNGTFMEVQGVAFGVARDLLEWFGPTMPIDQCSRANAKIYKAIDGDAYFGGSLSAGVLRNASSSSGLSVSEVAQVGPFGSNGRPVKYIASWSYRTETLATYPATNQGLRQYNAAAAEANAPSDTVGGNFGTKTTERPGSNIVLSRAFGGGNFVQIDQRSFTTETSTFNGLAPTPGDAPGRANITTTIGGGFTVNDPVQSAADRTVKLTLARGFTGFGDSVSQLVTIVSTEE